MFTNIDPCFAHIQPPGKKTDLHDLREPRFQVGKARFPALSGRITPLDIMVKGALTFAHAVKRQRRGKRSGALVRIHQRNATRNISLQCALTVSQLR